MVIALIALIVVGPEQLPGVMRRVGQTVNRLRAMSLGLRDEFMHGMDEFDPRTWMEDDATSARGTGGADDPIVPRGYANAASGEVRASVTGSNDTDPVVDALVEPVVDPVAADGDATTDETATDETVDDPR